MATSGYRSEKQKMLAGELTAPVILSFRQTNERQRRGWSGTMRRSIWRRVRDTSFYANN